MAASLLKESDSKTMLSPARPDAAASARRLQDAPKRGRAIIACLRDLNRASRVLPAWRESQLVKFVETVNLYIEDLNERYEVQRIDSLANTTRNLLELYIWVLYCNRSAENARRFFEDGARDTREIMESLQKLYTQEKQEPQREISQTIKKMENAAALHGITDYAGRYTQVRDAAEAVGKISAFNVFYKVFSKLSHPTSLFLALDPRVGGLSDMLDALYVGGEQSATHSLNQIDAALSEAFRATASTTR